jgi:hypothetical protein
MVLNFQESAFVRHVFQRLAEICIASLAKVNSQNNYIAHVGNLAEVVEWTWEFFDHYYPGIIDWPEFEKSSENIFNSQSMEEFICAFGHARFLKFCLDHGDSADYFMVKYQESYVREKGEN